MAETTTTAETTSEPPQQSEATPTTGATSGFSTPADAAIVYGTESAEAFLVGTRISFTLTDRGTLTTDADGARHVRGAVGQSTFSGNDPRIPGSEAFTFNSDCWGPSFSDSALTQWGTTVLSTADGTWEGNFSGVYTTAKTDVITYWLEGTGAHGSRVHRKTYENCDADVLFFDIEGMDHAWPLHEAKGPGAALVAEYAEVDYLDETRKSFTENPVPDYPHILTS